jgi:hypothetical protein
MENRILAPSAYKNNKTTADENSLSIAQRMITIIGRPEIMSFF